MIDFINTAINYIGTGNLVAIVCLLLGTLIATYFYFRTFYRLVFSTERICVNFKNRGDWMNKDNLYKTRVLFFNNGRKTLTNDDKEILEIVSTENNIKSAKVLEDKNIDLLISESSIDIGFNYLDSREFFVVEVMHYGSIQVNGRISETGKITEKSTQFWNITSTILLALFFILMFYTAKKFVETKNMMEHLPLAINTLFLFLIYGLNRFIEYLFFIPFKINSRYLKTRRKTGYVFKNVF